MIAKPSEECLVVFYISMYVFNIGNLMQVNQWDVFINPYLYFNSGLTKQLLK